MIQPTRRVCDLAVIGGGPAGTAAALHAAKTGLDTVLISDAPPGGICLHWGCIPLKTLLQCAKDAEIVSRTGMSSPADRFDWAGAVARSRAVVDRLAQALADDLERHKITLLIGHATLAPDGIAVDTEAGALHIAPKRTLIATGARPRRIPGIVPDGIRIITSREALMLSEPPSSLLVIGGGAVGVEFASLLADAGTSVTLVEQSSALLPGLDTELTKRLAVAFRRRGIAIRTGATVERVENSADGCSAFLTDGTIIAAERILLATGHDGALLDPSFTSAGLALDNGFIAVDSHCRTSLPNIWAAGDCIGAPLLAHAATSEGICAANDLLCHPAERPDSRRVPVTALCRPGIASVGLTEEEAHAQGYSTIVGRCPFGAIGAAHARGDIEGFVKIVADAHTRALLGIHIIGPEAGALVGEATLALTLGATVDHLASVCHAHPTLAEALGEAARAMRT